MRAGNPEVAAQKPTARSSVSNGRDILPDAWHRTSVHPSRTMKCSVWTRGHSKARLGIDHRVAELAGLGEIRDPIVPCLNVRVVGERVAGHIGMR